MGEVVYISERSTLHQGAAPRKDCTVDCTVTAHRLLRALRTRQRFNRRTQVSTFDLSEIAASIHDPAVTEMSLRVALDELVEDGWCERLAPGVVQWLPSAEGWQGCSCASTTELGKPGMYDQNRVLRKVRTPVTVSTVEDYDDQPHVRVEKPSRRAASKPVEKWNARDLAKHLAELQLAKAFGKSAPVHQGAMAKQYKRHLDAGVSPKDLRDETERFVRSLVTGMDRPLKAPLWKLVCKHLDERGVVALSTQVQMGDDIDWHGGYKPKAWWENDADEEE